MLNKIKRFIIAMAMVVTMIFTVLGLEVAFRGSWYGFIVVVVSVIGFIAAMKVMENEIEG